MKTLNTKAEKIKHFGFAPHDVVSFNRQYSMLYRLKDENDSTGIAAAAESAGLIDDVTHIVSNMTVHPNEPLDNEKCFKLFNLVRQTNSQQINKWVSFYLFSVPEELVLFATQFDTTKYKIHMHIQMEIFIRDAAKLSDEFLNRCDTITVSTDMGTMGVYSSEP